MLYHDIYHKRGILKKEAWNTRNREQNNLHSLSWLRHISRQLHRRSGETDINTQEPIITCLKCKAEIKLNESLAAPLIEATRREYEQRLTQKDTLQGIAGKTLQEIEGLEMRALTAPKAEREESSGK